MPPPLPAPCPRPAAPADRAAAPRPRPALRAALAARALLGALAALALAGCAALPPRGTPEPSQAPTDTAGTPLARIAADSLAAARQAPGAAAGAGSAFRLLPTGEFAFDARTALAARATRTLDLQYYHVHDDQAGRALLRALRDAAQRGVRVRLLVDDFHAGEIQQRLADLAAVPGVQVRLFNPLALRHGPPTLRLLLSPGEFDRRQRRMHNKLFVADNALAVFGGRNVADEYFMNHAEANFIDLDLLGAGAVVPALSAAFDAYWNSALAWPVHTVLGAPDDAGAARARFDAGVRDARPQAADYRLDPLGQTAVGAQLDSAAGAAGGAGADGAAGVPPRMILVAGDAEVHADPPDKVFTAITGPQPSAAMAGILATMGRARREVAIMTPYFLPGEVGMPMMREAARHGVRTVVYTNSLASTDEPLVHHLYQRYRPELLRLGVQLHEFSPAMAQRSLGFGRFGRSVPRLHAKTAVIDERWLAVGSVNLDGRSAVANTEMSVVIDSPPLAAAARQLTQGSGSGAQATYRLRLQADGQTVEWLGTDAEGRPTVSTDEPGDHPALRLKLWLQSLLVPEHLL